jgi:signal transduction histidine kinase
MREGMLEAVPMLFGLLPARVDERECVAKGAERCVFDVRWRRLPRTGLWLGLVLGLALAAAGVAALWSLWPVWVVAAAAVVLWGLGVGAGRAFDLARQLEAVAGSRRGQLALLDQADQSLAEKLDSLARMGGQSPQPASRAPVADEGQGLVPVVRARPAVGTPAGAADRPDDDASLEPVRRAAAGIREALAGLRGRLADLEERLREQPAAAPEDLEPFFRDCLLESRRIEEIGGELARRVGPAAGERGRRELAPLVERVVASLHRQLGRELPIDLELAGDVPAVFCDAGQIEWLVEQLLRNAIAATPPAEGAEPTREGRVRVSLSTTPDGVELAVADEGEGIEEHTVDEVFDPFFGGSEAAVAGRDAPFGLTVCYRIVAEHGGELRVVSEAGRGTRVSALLPPAPRSGA